MKKLIKNAFKSLFSSRVGIVLLSIIVFMTAGTFTLLSSTSNTFNSSYNTVISKGNLHDFTVKELYSVDGDVSFDNKQGNIVSKIDMTPNNNYIKSAAPDYINFSASVLNDFKYNVYSSKTQKKSVNTFIRIKKDSIALQDSNKDGKVDSIVSTNGKLKIEVMGVKKYSWSSRSETEKDINNINVDKKYWKSYSLDPSSNILKIQSYSSGWFSTTKGIELEYDFNKLLGNIFNILNTNNMVKEQKGITFSVSNANTKGAYKNIINSVFDTDKKIDALARRELPNYPIYIDSKITDDKIISQIQEVINAKSIIKDAIRREVIKSQANSFVSDIDKLYGVNGTKGHKLDFVKVKSLEVNSNKGARKIVSAISKDRKIDNLVIFDGRTIPKYMLDGKTEFPLSKSSLSKYLEKKIGKNPATASGVKNFAATDKGYKISWTWLNSGIFADIPASASIVDPSSMMAVISPSFAKQRKIKFVDPSVILHLYSDAISKNIDETKYITENMIKTHKNSIVWVDNTPYFAIGSGTTPDFSYPIIGPDKPMADTKTQAVIFTNENGYRRIKDAFRASPAEDYLAYKFTNNAKNKDSIINDVESVASKDMAWGKTVNHIVSRTNDTSETVILAPQRIAFLEKLQKNIRTLSIILTTALIFFSTIVVALVVKKQINSKKKNFGILMANGFSKGKIALANTVIAFIIIVIPAAIGYITGHFLQFLLIDIFRNTWTLPITNDAFSWKALVIMVGMPFVATIVVSYLISLWEMRGTIPEIISGSTSKISAAISARTIGAFKYIGIKTKASMSLLLTNISKMILIIIATALSIVTISTSISTMHKFNDAKVASINAETYSYKINFISPTEEGGVMKTLPVSKLLSIHDGINMMKDRTVAHQVNPKFMVPVQKDGTFSNDSMFLDNLFQFKTMLNIFAGAMGMGANPWDIAKQLMPENQLNNANTHWEKFLANSVNVYKKKNNNKLPDFISFDSKTKKFEVIANKVNGGFLGFKVKQEFKDFATAGIDDAIQKFIKSGSVEDMPFFITYHNIIINDSDETYTSIETEVNLRNYKGNKNEEKIEITGIKDRTKYINLSDVAWKSLEKEKVSYENIKGKNTKIIPIVINKYMQKFYNLSIGDKFPMRVENSAKRFHNGSAGLIELKQEARVVGIQNSYNDLKAFTLQEYANDSLGWKASDKAFNGIFTHDDKPLLFNSVPLYSLSGFYPGTDTIQNNVSDPIYKNIEKDLSRLTNINQSVKKMDDYFKTYSTSPYVTFSNVNWSGADRFRFENITNISQAAILFIESITIFLAIMFIVIISIMMIEDNKKFIATMKVLGYRESEIRRIFFGSFIPSLVIGFLISAPIAFAMSLAITYGIMTFGAILIPLTLTWWTLAISLAISVGGLLIVYYFSTKGFKNTSVLQAFNQ